MKYTYEPSDDVGYDIYDLNGGFICWVLHLKFAQDLIAHLNRE